MDNIKEDKYRIKYILEQLGEVEGKGTFGELSKINTWRIFRLLTERIKTIKNKNKTLTEEIKNLRIINDRLSKENIVYCANSNYVIEENERLKEEKENIPGKNIKEIKMNEQNKLIDAFMGWKLEKMQGDYTDVWQFVQYDKDGQVLHVDMGGDSWNWEEGDTRDYNDLHELRGVLKRIDEMIFTDPVLNLHKIQILMTNLITPTEYTINLIVTFINLYNKSKL